MSCGCGCGGRGDCLPDYGFNVGPCGQRYRFPVRGAGYTAPPQVGYPRWTNRGPEPIAFSDAMSGETLVIVGQRNERQPPYMKPDGSLEPAVMGASMRKQAGREVVAVLPGRHSGDMVASSVYAPWYPQGWALTPMGATTGERRHTNLAVVALAAAAALLIWKSNA